MLKKTGQLLREIFRDVLLSIPMRMSFDAAKRARGKELSSAANRRLMTWLITPFACLTAAVSAATAAIPPYGTFSLTIVILSAIVLWLAFPVPLKARDTWRIVVFRWGCALPLGLMLGVLMEFHKEEIESALPTDVRGRMAEKRTARDEQLAKKAEMKRQAEEDAARVRRMESDARIENRRQREFYAQLGAPKLLYRCNGSLFEIAIGAESGTLNRLIKEAKNRCGDTGYEIIKRKE